MPITIDSTAILIAGVITFLAAASAYLKSRTLDNKVAAVTEQQAALKDDTTEQIKELTRLLGERTLAIERMNTEATRLKGIIDGQAIQIKALTDSIASRDLITSQLETRMTKTERENNTLVTITTRLEAEKIDLQGLISGLVDRLKLSDRPLSSDTAAAALGAPPAPAAADVAAPPLDGTPLVTPIPVYIAPAPDAPVIAADLNTPVEKGTP